MATSPVGAGEHHLVQNRIKHEIFIIITKTLSIDISRTYYYFNLISVHDLITTFSFLMQQVSILDLPPPSALQPPLVVAGH